MFYLKSSELLLSKKRTHDESRNSHRSQDYRRRDRGDRDVEYKWGKEEEAYVLMVY